MNGKILSTQVVIRLKRVKPAEKSKENDKKSKFGGKKHAVLVLEEQNRCQLCIYVYATILSYSYTTYSVQLASYSTIRVLLFVLSCPCLPNDKKKLLKGSMEPTDAAVVTHAVFMLLLLMQE